MRSEEATPQGLVSIERVVAFVLGPLVIAGAGWLSTWLAQNLGVPISGEAIVGIFASGGLAAGALVWRWLGGRQLEMKLTALPASGTATLTQALAPVRGGQPPGEAAIPPAAHDPAPSGQPGADVGAAQTQ